MEALKGLPPSSGGPSSVSCLSLALTVTTSQNKHHDYDLFTYSARRPLLSGLR